ncbi:MAG TPA: hypothetical protein VGK73_08800 [Polyangiaceae bacterium]
MRKLAEQGTLPDGFEFFSWKVVGTDGALMEGGVPRLLKSGKRKGQKTWRDCDETYCVVVTQGEVAQEERDYEQTTGKCHACYGDGQEWAGWNIYEGTKYRQCKRCGGDGKAPGGSHD